MPSTRSKGSYTYISSLLRVSWYLLFFIIFTLVSRSVVTTTTLTQSLLQIILHRFCIVPVMMVSVRYYQMFLFNLFSFARVLFLLHFISDTFILTFLFLFLLSPFSLLFGLGLGQENVERNRSISGWRVGGSHERYNVHWSTRRRSIPHHEQ